MSVFKRQISTYPALGELRYGCRYWKGTIVLEALGGSFDLIVRASRDGPSAAQIAAMSRAIADAASIKIAASKKMADLHAYSEILSVSLNSNAYGIWGYLHPLEIEVSDESFYEDGRIAIFIIFESTLHRDFAPAIETADGFFVEVLSGT